MDKSLNDTSFMGLEEKRRELLLKRRKVMNKLDDYGEKTGFCYLDMF